MKLVLYTEDYNVLDVFENIQNPIVDGNTVEWDTGALHGINVPFLLLDDTVDTSSITEEVKAQCRGKQFTKVDLFQENKSLKERLTYAEDAILFLMDRG